MTVSIQPAGWPEDEPAISLIRDTVFIQEQGVPRELEWDGMDPRCTHLLAWSDDNLPVGTARITPDGHIGRMAVLRKWRGQGIGGDLLKTLVALAAGQGIASVFIHAQTQAQSFYERFGFQAVGDEFMEAGIPHRKMVLHLK